MKNIHRRRDRLAALRIVAIYALVAVLWILVSDTALGILFLDPAHLLPVAVAKGFLFVAVTGLLLYQLIAQYLRDRSRIEEELRVSQGLVSSLLEGTTDVVYAKDRQGRYLLANPAAIRIAGRRPEEVIGHDDSEVFPSEQAQALMTCDRQVMEAGRVSTFEEHLTIGDGSLRTFLAAKGPIYDAAGQVNGVFGIARDITERKQAEQHLMDSERRFQSLFDNMLEGLASCRMILEPGQPPDFEYLNVNPAFEQLTGLKNVVGKRVSQVIPGIQEADPELFEIYGRVAMTGKPETFELHLQALDEWFSVSVYCPEKGQFVAVFDVITQRKQAEVELRESESKFRSYVENAPVAVFVVDREGRYVDNNQAAIELLGYDSVALAQMRIPDIVPVEDHDAVMPDFARLLDEGRVEGDYRLTRRDGRLIWVSLRAVRLNDNYFISYCQDVTELRRAMQTLRERLELQEQLANVAATVPGMIASLRQRPDGSISMPYATSPALDELYGLQPADVLEDATPALAKIHPDDADRVSEAMVTSARELTPFREEWRVLHPRKGEIWVEGHTMPQREADGGTIWHGFVHDVTARKQADQTREATVELLRMCNEAANSRDLIRELTAYFQRVTGCEAVGVRLREGDDFPYYETRGFPEEFVLVERSLCAYDQKGELIRDCAGHPALECMCGNVVCGRFDPSKPFFTPNGSFWSSCTTELLATTTDADRQAKTRNRCNGEGYESVALVPLRTQGRTFGLFQFNDRRAGRFTAETIAFLESLVGYVAIAMAKQVADDALREASQFNEQVIRSAGAGVIVYGPDLRYQAWNPFMERLTGVPASEVLGQHPAEVFPFLREAGVIERIEKALAGQSSVRIEFPYHIASSGQSGWTSDTTAPLRNTKDDIIGAIGTVADISERVRAEEALRETTRRLQLATASAGLGIWDWDISGDVLVWDDRMLELYGIPKETFSGRSEAWQKALHPDDRDEVMEANRAALAGERDYDSQFRILQPDGSVRIVQANGMVVRDDDGRPVRMIGISRDVTEQTTLEARFRQAQKMEVVGHLAGGVAHDFNNILTAIIGYANLVNVKIPKKDLLHDYVDQILAASEKAANLTHSLLAFSRKQVINPTPVDVNEIVTSMKKMLARIISEDIEFRVETADRELIVKSDRSQIEQVLVNLAANARDAMPHGGTLTIATEEVEIDDRYVQIHQAGTVGRYASITVSDTGVGMDKATQEHIFEPFYTTKQIGKGTGLGLAMVYGTVKQHDGFINVYSEPGTGTTFRVYLPLSESAEPRMREKEPLPVSSGSETLLLLEDDAAVRTVTRRLLEGLGYRVIEAVDGEHAIELFVENQDRIQLVVSDVIMPGMSGKDVYAELRQIMPDVKVLFISGYTADILGQKGLDGERINFISKPLRPDELSTKLREILDGP